ncbi:MAG: homocysteine S-methyltransferase family protein [Rubinisphaera brasiliensis]|uniref:homocysteine S-methyltransferase family protein n=1 Tax=Rubinisphaera brasiliensis TaxID=119 RepID=UPI00391A1938
MQRSISQFLAETEDWILLDGPMGTRLAELGYSVDRQPGWSAQALVDVPELVEQVHREYVAAGATAVTANTFRTHAVNLAAWGMQTKAKSLTSLAVQLARQAAEGKAWVLGSQAPVGDCYSPNETPSAGELRAAHREMAENLNAAGVDAVLLETHVSQQEALIALEAVTETGLPALLSVVARDETHLLDGSRLQDLAEQAAEYRPLAIGANCIPVERMGGALTALQSGFAGPLIAYANTGEMLPDGNWRPTAGSDPEVHSEFAQRWISQGVRILGTCCGCGPRWIEKISCLPGH